MSHASRCKSCLLPSTVPGANLGDDCVCAPCHTYQLSSFDDGEGLRKEREADLEQALEDCRGQGEYDCILNLSGGKDSCYLLYKLVREYKLNVLAFTMDANIPDVAWKNIRRTIDKLDVPMVTFRPPREFYRKLFRLLLQNQEARGAVRTVCYVCAPLYEAYSLNLALEKNIPLVLAAYSPGQPDPERMEYEFSRDLICRQDWTPALVKDSGLFDENELRMFWNPFRYPAGTEFPRYLAPFHAWPYSQDETMKEVVAKGLIVNRKHASPVHSNCPVNWLLMYSDLKNLGYNPYAPEFSRLIREGKADRWYWKIMGPVVDFMIRKQILLGRNVTRSMQWLGMQENELKITRAAEDSTGSGDGVSDETPELTDAK
ncbi:MAG: hypothetical protein KDB27_31280 [Planctomycetales bacterium]|nr:hypothetical protein [Planctomycetales bacterium]